MTDKEKCELMLSVWARKIASEEVVLFDCVDDGIYVYTDELGERYAFKYEDYAYPSLVIDTVTHEVAVFDDVFRVTIYPADLNISEQFDFITLLSELLILVHEHKYKVYRY